MKLPELKIGTKTAKIPIVQGGMAIRLSTARLAASVAKEGGIGLIAASGMAHDELRYEIKLARSLTDGIIGINIMVAASDFFGIVRTAIDAGIDLIVAGAGFSRDIFGLGRESGTPIVPIVSSVKLAKISEKLGASAIVVEGKEAGGAISGIHDKVQALKGMVVVGCVYAFLDESAHVGAVDGSHVEGENRGAGVAFGQGRIGEAVEIRLFIRFSAACIWRQRAAIICRNRRI